MPSGCRRPPRWVWPPTDSVPVAHGHWIALTVLMVLRPETAHTYTRCVGRVAGIAAGIVVASVLTHGLAADGFFGGRRGGGVSRGDVRGRPVRIPRGECGIGRDHHVSARHRRRRGRSDPRRPVVRGGRSAVAWRWWLTSCCRITGLIRLHQRAGELLKSEIDYAAAVVKAFVHELDHPAEALSAAWQRAFRARAAFEAASGATRADSRELRRWLRSYRAALNAVTSACTSLETSLSSEPSTALTPEFVAAVDDYVDALRAHRPARPRHGPSTSRS